MIPGAHAIYSKGNFCTESNQNFTRLLGLNIQLSVAIVCHRAIEGQYFYPFRFDLYFCVVLYLRKKV